MTGVNLSSTRVLVTWVSKCIIHAQSILIGHNHSLMTSFLTWYYSSYSSYHSLFCCLNSVSHSPLAPKILLLNYKSVSALSLHYNTSIAFFALHIIPHIKWVWVWYIVYMHTCMIVSVIGTPSNIEGLLVLDLWCPKQLSSITDSYWRVKAQSKSSRVLVTCTEMVTSTLHGQSILIGQCSTSPYMDISTLFALIV